MIVLFPLKENAFSYHCEVNKNNWIREAGERASVNISRTVQRVCKVRGKSAGTGVREAIYMNSPF